MQSPYKIAVDAMGGDNSPRAVVEGALLAAREGGVNVILVGVQEKIERELEGRLTPDLPISIKHASEVVEMNEPPAVALRKKKDSSIRVALELVKHNEAHAVVSAGHTGATLAASTLILKPLKGVDRPAIATIIPTTIGTSILLDVGANVDCKASQLLQFGVMGYVYAKYVLKKLNPSVGLLSIGEEDIKGNEATKEAFRLLKESSINFVGNVEAKEIFRGHADVVVCDGFTGNIALKVCESAAEFLEHNFKQYYHGSWRWKLGALLMLPELKRLKRKMDYSEYGGGPLLGINGTCIIAHGSSSPAAIKNAIYLAEKLLQNKVNNHIQDDVAFNAEIQLQKESRGSLWKNIKGTIPFSGEKKEGEGIL